MSLNNQKKKLYKVFGKLIIRTPIHSLKLLSAEFRHNHSSLFLEGLYLSSPDFLSQLSKGDTLNVKDKLKTEDSLLKYWIRSCTRCTPYGTFAGTAILDVTEQETKITLASSDKHKKKIRVDMNYLSLIIKNLSQNIDIQNKILFFPNNSIYEIFDEYRYVEYTIVNNTRIYNLVSVEKSGYLRTILDYCENGAYIVDLVNVLVSQEDVSNREAQEYIDNLIDSQLLVSALEPRVTGFDTLEKCIADLSTIIEMDDRLLALKILKQQLTTENPDLDCLKEIDQQLILLDQELVKPSTTLQADLFLALSHNKINSNIVESILKQVNDLLVFSVKEKIPSLQNFINAFQNKYGEQEVALSKAIDLESGIGYGVYDENDTGGSKFIDDLIVPTATIAERAFTYIQKFAIDKYYEWMQGEVSFIEISEKELSEFSEMSTQEKLPQSMYIMGTLLESDPDQIDAASDFVFDLNGVTGPSGANIIGRFAYGDENIYNLTKEVLLQEELGFEDTIFAEIVHLPQARLGNILLRPLLRAYEIPYVGVSGANKENQITVDDLYIKIEGGLITLKSRRLNKKVIPRLTTAHNYHLNSLPIYKFLCDLQRQDIALPVLWDWGRLHSFKDLPRVVYKNLIVKKAEWTIDEMEFALFMKKQGDKSETGGLVDFCKSKKMPFLFQYSEGDNNLLIDLRDENMVSILRAYLKKFARITVIEYLQTLTNCVVEDDEGDPYTNELIIPIYRDVLPQQSLSAIEMGNSSSSVQRKFNLNSEWLYFKIYCGPNNIEKILVNFLLDFVHSDENEKMFEKFFFIRYKDESSHLRIRFYNTNPENNLILQRSFLSAIDRLLQNEVVDKIIIDTYDRELARYLPLLIEDTESLFHYDSLAVLQALSVLQGNEDDRYRILIALIGINTLMDDFGMSLTQKYQVTKNIQQAFYEEHGGHERLQKQLNDSFRLLQKDISTAIEYGSEDSILLQGYEIFRQRSADSAESLRSILNKIDHLEDREVLMYLLPSYIHMFMNRLFVAQQRKHELVVYHLLERFFYSKQKQLLSKIQKQNAK